MVAGVGVLAVLVGIGRSGTATHPTPSVTPSPPGPLEATSGKVVYSDDFRDASSGWSTAKLPSGSIFSYQSGKYVVFAKGTLHHYAESPYALPHKQLTISVTGTQAAGAPDGAGFGVTCRRGLGPQQVRYQFLVLAGGQFFIEGGNGPDSGTTASCVG